MFWVVVQASSGHATASHLNWVQVKILTRLFIYIKKFAVKYNQQCPLFYFEKRNEVFPNVGVIQSIPQKQSVATEALFFGEEHQIKSRVGKRINVCC